MVQARRASRDYTPPSFKLCRQMSMSSLRSWRSNRSACTDPPSPTKVCSDLPSPTQPPQMRKAKSSVSLVSAMSNASARLVWMSAVRAVVNLNWNVVRPFAVALIPTTGAVAMKWYQMDNPDAFPDGFFPESEVAYSTLSWILGIVLVFRTGQSYNRFWDGANYMTLLKTELFDACGQIISFAESSDVDRSKKDAFQLTVVRLYSLLHGVALQQVSQVENEDIQVLDPAGLDKEQVKFMRTYNRKVRTDIVMQWICRAITEGVKTGIVATPAPLVSRVLEESNSAFVSLSRMRAIADIPFPVPYATMVSLLLLCHTILSPFFAVSFSNSRIWAGMFSFLPVFSLWSIQCIARELEQPFGNGVDDLDLPGAQAHMNDCLASLLHPRSQWSPDLEEIAASPKCVSMNRVRESPKSVFQINACRVTKSSSGLSSVVSSHCSHPSRHSRNSPFHLDCSRMTRSSLSLDQIGESLFDEESPSGGETLQPSRTDDENLLQSNHNETVFHVDSRQSSADSQHGSQGKPEDPPGLLHLETSAVGGTERIVRGDEVSEVVNNGPSTMVTKHPMQNYQSHVILKEVEKREQNGEGRDVTYEEDRNHANIANSATHLARETANTSPKININKRTDTLDQLLQNNNHCLALFKTLDDAATLHRETGKVAEPCNQVKADQESSSSSMGLPDHFERMRCSKDSTRSKASECSIPSSESSVSLPASLPMPAFCRASGRAQNDVSRNSL
eukprot:gnl/MRDRNA2_/MRDRNA2_107149_c0_seq1.p1 gnl/MRDRNA2_/MRDRNA2_107149_c0~~gnl/MRDRNA2_/MRDRNA2_107149_c0_seq1.p1  ORF type:complete len:733 (-),score=90.35 gnl/MRDRNA2_/MRDRNA2_107149_c0_seq1:858-3056(-)